VVWCWKVVVVVVVVKCDQDQLDGGQGNDRMRFGEANE
jgi:hypothetical protein